MFVDCVYDSNQVVDAIQNMEAVESVEYLYTDVWDIWGYGNLYLIQF
jgi:hypothetical protein